MPSHTKLRYSAYWLSRAFSVLLYVLGCVVILRATATKFDITEHVAWVYMGLLFVLVDAAVGLVLLIVFSKRS